MFTLLENNKCMNRISKGDTMRSKAQVEELLGSFIGDEQREMAHSGRSERDSLRRTSMGDRQSDAFARQIAMAPVYDRLLHPNIQTDAPTSPKASSTPTDSNRALSEEIDRQNSRRSTSKKAPEKADTAWTSAFIDPSSYGELVLAPQAPVKNPKIVANTDDGKSGLKNFKLAYITQDRKKILTNVSTLNDLGSGVIFSGVVDKDHPIKISVLNTTKYRLSLQATLSPS